MIPRYRQRRARRPDALAMFPCSLFSAPIQQQRRAPHLLHPARDDTSGTRLLPFPSSRCHDQTVPSYQSSTCSQRQGMRHGACDLGVHNAGLSDVPLSFPFAPAPRHDVLDNISLRYACLALLPLRRASRTCSKSLCQHRFSLKIDAAKRAHRPASRVLRSRIVEGRMMPLTC